MCISFTRTLALILTLSISTFGFSQVSPTPPSDQIQISGKLVQGSNQEPLPFATIAIYAVADSNIVNNTLTEDNGTFSMEVPPGKYYAEISYIGFEDKTLSDISIAAGQAPLDLGMVDMRADAVALQEVEVRAEKSQMEFKLDRRVFNVGKDLTNAGNSAADILDNVPSVTVDPEGNVSLRGSQGVRILVNGKPSGLLSAGETEALLRMQGDIIQSVEVITNPSARYEAEGEAGIINIILKKNQEKGVNGSFGITAGHPSNYGASYNLNLRRQKFNFFSNFGIDYRRGPGGGLSTQRFFDDGVLTEYYSTDRDQVRGGLGGYMQLGADWYLNDKNIMTASLLYRAGEDDNDATVTYRDFDSNQNVVAKTVRDIDETEKENNLEFSLDYTKTFDKKDQEWKTTFKYILDDETELAEYRQTSDETIGLLQQRSSNTEDEINLLVQSDYVHPFTESSRMEAGLRAAIRTINNDFLVEEQQNGEFVTLPSFDDQLKYNENIYAAYLIGGTEFGAFSFQGGVRAELSDITATLVRSSQSNEQNYLSFFPSASLSYEITQTQQLQLSYSRRLSRPYFRRLLPFSNFNDPRNNNVGNPNLRPEFTDSYELGYLKYFDRGTMLSSIYYRNTSGVIEELILPGEDGTSIEFPVNLSTRNSYGLEFNFSYDLTDAWDVTTDFNFFRAMINGQYEDIDYSADTYSWNSRLNSKIQIGEPVQLQTSFRYRAPRNTPQGRRLSSASLDIAGSVDVFSGKGTLTLSCRDLLNTRKRRSIVDLPNFKSESVFQWRQARQVVLTFNYRLNQDKKPDRGGDRDDFDE
ncbi:TonB-dependent receptor [Flavilitoribacter nigricans]|uniref:TonB-dependent receptor n=1 Tax=Flavilitoribacter nigricans (strain ATCC 23147 / DSM 23189 / NBRC 102662 / NCIMB 1420 / SS-2) TaxID=1122177 RepID=A0A2D0MZ61_FLAN2|nr:TonB-dependent receptor [Flavilitoribacter nigricans]PHN00743.1 TonB-dependent receptor [Flavilitoribacter nigricans DSM 23189 = NBRC 102662]